MAREKPKKSFFPQNGGENYFRFRFSVIFLFYTLDLVIPGKNLKKFSGALFEIFGVKVENFKNYLNELQEFCTRNFVIFSGRCGPLPLCQNSFTFVQ